MRISFWKKKRALPDAEDKGIVEKRASVLASRAESAIAATEKVESQHRVDTSQVRQTIQRPPEYSKPIAWPWSIHALILEHPDTLPKPGVRPSTAPSLSPFPRYGHCISPTTTSEGDLILFGGWVNGSSSNDVYTISIRDGTTRSIETTGDIPSPRVGHACVLIGNMLYVWGGDTRAGDDTGLDNSLYRLDLVERNWLRVSIPHLPPGRYGHAMCAVGDTIYIFGGQVDGTFLNDLRTVDLSFTELPLRSPEGPQPAARTNHIFIPHEDDIYLFGGTDGEYMFNDIWSFNVKSQQWSELPAIGHIPAPREGHSAALIDGVIYIFGGRGVDGRCLGDIAAFRVAYKRWYTFRNMGPGPSARSGHAMAAVNNTAFVLGGLSDDVDARQPPSVVHVLETGNLKYPPIPITGHADSGIGHQK
ncbi:hypothetical protein BXZ70DRAFT_943483 [Cristinia sonorae]|uniref:Galactose oxidase n=1 Tax=Cristinia sonorae TaxID=1940300 RepID=A0A8K0UNI0_9AGAR|nr:hypothetical protein BXZ70DRAFT_943483 [Cristinia sonorae]